jgi:thiamine-phosphate pyrophosphorylase
MVLKFSNKSNKRLAKGVYLISPEKILHLEEFAQTLEFLLKSCPIPFFQLRLKGQEIKNEVKVLKEICEQNNTIFVMNDSLEMAQQSNISALHIGKFDGDLKEVRKKWNGILGISCYNDLERAFIAEENGADYVSFGAFFQSKTKPNATPCDIEVLHKFKAKSDLPVCVIGGINSFNSKGLIENGADLIALSSGVWGLLKREKMANEISLINLHFKNN